MPTTEEQRRARAAAQIGEAKLDALLVTNLHNIRYLTGFTGSNGSLLLLRGGEAHFLTDPRYDVQARQQVTCKVSIVKGPMHKAAARAMQRARVRRVGFESTSLHHASWKALTDAAPAGVSLRPSDGIVEQLRAVKDAAELAAIRASCITNSLALEAALLLFRRGMTESELAAEIDYQSRKLGASGPAFDTIVASGPHSALPHAQPRAEPITAGPLLIDMGAFENGYASDMTRTFHVGEPTPKFRRNYKAVLDAQQASLDAVRHGASTRSVDGAGRAVLKAHNLDQHFTHSTGHGLGLEIHERPRIARTDRSRLAAGMAVTIEPGIYLEGWGGIRIEDTVVVTDRGCEIVTPTPKDLRVLGS